jgi:hypothetical protein
MTARTSPIALVFPKSSSFVLVLIGVFKLLKTRLLITIGISAIKFSHKDIRPR